MVFFVPLVASAQKVDNYAILINLYQQLLVLYEQEIAQQAAVGAPPSFAVDQVRVGNATFAVELATTTAEQEQGLSFRKNLAEESGLLFIFNPGIQNFWMKDMNFPIDIIWIANNKVVGFVQDAAPEPGTPLQGLAIYTSPDDVNQVLEVNAGTVAQDDITVGDTVTANF